MTAHLARHTLLYLCHSLTLTFGLTLQTRLKLVRNNKTHTASRCMLVEEVDSLRARLGHKHV